MGNLFLYVLTVGIWGTTWIAITFQLGNVPESWSVAYRFALAAIVLHLFCLARGFRLRFGLAPHLHFLGLGLFLFSANYWLVYLSTDHLASGLVAVVFSIMSVFNIFNAMLFLGKPLERRALLSAGLGLTGVTFIFWPEVQSLSLSDEGAVGLALALGSAMLASWGNTISARTSSEGLTVHAMNAWSMTYGAT
ncbi:MAG: DMT family transporter, partial [Sphingomonadales bacterium]